MTEKPFTRTERLLGTKAMERLAHSRVIVFGIGGVGGYVVEGLVRSGIGAIDIVDNDTVAVSNLNRQIIASRDTIGRAKTDVMKERILSINPDIQVTVHRCFYLPDTADQFDFTAYDYIADCVDTVTAKIDMIMRARACGTPIISSMGAGNRLDPSRFRVSDIYQTTMDPLSRVMRRELRRRGVESLKVVWSSEQPITPAPAEGTADAEHAGRGKIAPGSVAFVPPAAGMLIASEIVRDLTGIHPTVL